VFRQGSRYLDHCLECGIEIQAAAWVRECDRLLWVLWIIRGPNPQADWPACPDKRYGHTPRGVPLDKGDFDFAFSLHEMQSNSTVLSARAETLLRYTEEYAWSNRVVYLENPVLGKGSWQVAEMHLYPKLGKKQTDSVEDLQA
jgi:hypothetical protein